MRRAERARRTAPPRPPTLEGATRSTRPGSPQSWGAGGGRSALALYQSFNTLLLAAMVGISGLNLLLLRRRGRESRALPAAPPRVSILVPARDEAAKIAACVESLVAQDYPGGAFEVLVLDDRSTDGTGAIVAGLAARRPRLRPLRGAEPPPGWGGKAHACQQLAEAATGDWLLCVDADTVHAPAMLRATVGAALGRGATVLTTLPRERAVTLGERLLVPHLFFLLLALQPIPLLEGARFRLFAFANGQFLLIRRDLYARVGGHAAVRDQLMEDMALGRACKRAGADLLLLDGGDWTACRMYDGFGDAWRGFIRSLQAGSRLAPPYVFGVGALTLLFFVGPFALLAWRLARGGPRRLAAGQVAALLAIRALVGRELRQAPSEVALFPAGAAVLGSAAVVTTWRRARGEPIHWRGREYAAERRARGAG